ncbi:MAG: hypothetical protein IPM79_09760 [Polyangiaceae bacterium]|jgi:hypothetical protein|nr:hypothetical protein [Polyangiaceae bacterium]MBK8937908.1 hypothetical protein [Polyangiaceae bacterium]
MNLRALFAVAFLGASGVALAAACGGTETPDPVVPNKVGGSATAVEPVAGGPCMHNKLAKANLASASRIRDLVNKRRKVGIVPVKLTVNDKCEVDLQILDQCKGNGFYSYNPYSGRQRTQIRKPGDVNAELPLREEDIARRLDGGQIVISDEVYIGQYETTSSDLVRKQDLQGAGCIEATHYISKVYVGGFAMANGPAAELDKIDSVFYQPTRHVIAQEGNPDACRDANPKTRMANELCSVPLKIELAEFQTQGGPDATQCAHDPCEAGDKLDKTCNTCVEAVCNAVGYCCSSHWDSGCINKAKQICPNPCTNCAHKLCETGAKLESDCSPCVQKVCAQDSFCCTNSWDQGCADKVATVCGLSKDELKAQSCPDKPQCTGGQFWDGAKCTCSPGQNWDGFACITPPPPAQCHDVCVSGARQLSSCDTCTAKVCKDDPFCCNNSWDTGCIEKAKKLCFKCGKAPVKKQKGAPCSNNGECSTNICKAGKCAQPGG